MGRWGLCPQTPEVSKGMTRVSKGEPWELKLPRLGAFGAPSVRVSLAGLLFSSAPLCFPERCRRYTADEEGTNRYGGGCLEDRSPMPCKTDSCTSRFWES